MQIKCGNRIRTRTPEIEFEVDSWWLTPVCSLFSFNISFACTQSICLLIFLLVFDLPCRLLIFDWIPREYSLDSRAVAHKPWLHLATVLSPSLSLPLWERMCIRQTKTELMKISYSHSMAWQILFPPSPTLLVSISVCSILFFSGTCLRERNPHREFSFSVLFHFFRIQILCLTRFLALALSLCLSPCLGVFLYLRFYLWAS